MKTFKCFSSQEIVNYSKVFGGAADITFTVCSETTAASEGDCGDESSTTTYDDMTTTTPVVSLIECPE